MSAVSASVSFRHGAMPWGATPDDEERFRRITQRVLLVCFALAVALPWLPVFKAEVPERATLPPPAARLILEPVPVLPLRTPPPQAKAAPEPAAKPAPVQADVSVSKPAVAQAKPDPSKARPVTEARNPEANKPPGEALDAARRKASGVGLLAMKNELAELNGAPAAVQLRSDIKPGPGIGTGSGVGVGAGTEAGAPARALITSNATNGSGGINTAAYSRNTGGGGLAGRSTTLVDGVAGGGGGGGAGVGGGGKGNGLGTGGSGGMGGGGGAAKGGSVQRSGSGKASRSIEDIKLVFERNKGAIYALYNRALRDEPALHGKVVLELKIAPTGEVVDCRVVSSELHAEELERKLLARIRQFDFGAKEVEQMVVSWPVDFLPS